jgi:hypothetical protein|tara:strand:- start:1551 stop:1733 length:183 start_codon:yes stop_codon:yes gene_type:complete
LDGALGCVAWQGEADKGHKGKNENPAGKHGQFSMAGKENSQKISHNSPGRSKKDIFPQKV